jgi:hypothetical protein
VNTLRACRAGVRILLGAREFSLLQIVHIGWSPTSLLFNMYRGSFPKEKWPADAVNPHTSTPLTCRHGLDRGHIELLQWTAYSFLQSIYCYNFSERLSNEMDDPM